MHHSYAILYEKYLISQQVDWELCRFIPMWLRKHCRITVRWSLNCDPLYTQPKRTHLAHPWLFHISFYNIQCTCRYYYSVLFILNIFLQRKTCDSITEQTTSKNGNNLSTLTNICRCIYVHILITENHFSFAKSINFLSVL